MFLKLVSLCIILLFLRARSQRVLGFSNNAYNTDFSTSWNSNNGYSNKNNKPSLVSSNEEFWKSNFPTFDRKPNEKPFENEKSSNWEYETASDFDKTSGWNSNKPKKTSSDWPSDFNRRGNEKKLNSITNFSSSSKLYSNSNSFPFTVDRDNNLAFSSWNFNTSKAFSDQSNNQNSRPKDRKFNNPKQNESNGNLSNLDYEEYSAISSGSSNDNTKSKPASNSYGGSENWDSANQKNNKNFGTLKLDIKKNKKSQKTSESNAWESNKASQSGISGDSKAQNEKQLSTLDTSILDELDKNDWYFGKESNYPKPPFRSMINIDVSELWNFDKNKKSNQNNRGSSSSSSSSNSNANYNYNYNKRRNRQIERLEKTDGIQCECVNVNLCEEQDMIISQDDLKFDSSFRTLVEFRCKKLTDVCCTKPKIKGFSRANINEEKEWLQCGQRRTGENLFENFGDNIAKPGEFPWSLKLENPEINCSASLIHHKLALTAAHCVTGKKPEELTLKAGVWNTNNEQPQSRKIINTIVHPDYSSRNPRNDIALLVPETPFELTDNVNTICLPVTNDKWDLNQCVVAGWRPQEIQGQYLEVLEKAVVNFLPQTECQNIMLVTDLWRNYILHDSFICGLKKTGRKSCTEDEGSFVICPSKKQPSTYLQIGIVSKGINCDNFGRPGIFTNVLKFLDWINKNYFELELFDDIDIRNSQ